MFHHEIVSDIDDLGNSIQQFKQVCNIPSNERKVYFYRRNLIFYYNIHQTILKHKGFEFTFNFMTLK
jgi:hypothetical protein